MSGIVDITPPVVGKVTVSPDPVKAGEDITVHVQVSDDISGVNSVSIYGIMPSGKLGFESAIWGKTPEGAWYGTATVPKYSENGIWNIRIEAWDSVRNHCAQENTQTFVVISDQTDTTPPVIGKVTVSPDPVKTGDDITVHVEVSDDISGVNSVSVYGIMPSGKSGFASAIWEKTPEGAWYGTATIPKYSEDGIWNIRIEAWDSVRNHCVQENSKTFAVTSDQTDITPPVVGKVTVSPDLIKAGENISVQVEVSDDISGVNSVSIYGIMPSGKLGFASAIWEKTPAGAWYGTATIPKYSEKGKWNIRVEAWDSVRNHCVQENAQTFIVLPVDTTPPEPPLIDPIKTPTQQTPIVVSGNSEAKSLVQVFVNSIQRGSVSANKSGRFSVSGIDLDEGKNTITAKALDATGNESLESQPVDVLLDATPPVPPILAPITQEVHKVPIEISGKSEANAKVAIHVNNWLAGKATADSDGAFKFAVRLYDLSNLVTASAEDALGNKSVPSSPLHLTYTPHEKNIACNPAHSGFPTPESSDRGWGGGANKWEILDGKRTYPEWAHGLAFTGGRTSYAGQKCGTRQATVNFGASKTFNKVIVWHHGREHIPKICRLQYWKDNSWMDIQAERWIETEYSPISGYDVTPDIFTFPPLSSDQVRYTFDNGSENILGKLNEHGWLYEFEVFTPIVPLAYLPIDNIDGIGKVYAGRLTENGIAHIMDTENLDLDALHIITKIPLYKLYSIKRKAELAMSVKVNISIFTSLTGKRLGEIMTSSSRALCTSTGQREEDVRKLKEAIGTLLVALDNAVVRTLHIEDLE